MSSLVIVRCQRCRSKLGQLDVMPDDWTGMLRVSRCRKCVVPVSLSPDLAALSVLETGQLPENTKPGRRPRLIEALAAKNAPGFALCQDIPLADLRRSALKAARTGKPVTAEVTPDRRPV